MDLYNLREEYMSHQLDFTNVDKSPIAQFEKWFKEATEVRIYEQNAAILATADAHGHPSARVVLIKSFSEKGFDFFTNYLSRKGKELQENPFASIVFYWPELERQVRIEGYVEILSAEDSDKYFESRPVGSRLGAWASPQSKVITDRSWLEEKHTETREKFKHGSVPRPENWGGFRLIPNMIEFWQGRQNRLHDRIAFFYENTQWNIKRLAP
jgi:pyridoxamine 5'-phosphate oxidase